MRPKRNGHPDHRRDRGVRRGPAQPHQAAGPGPPPWTSTTRTARPSPAPWSSAQAGPQVPGAMAMTRMPTKRRIRLSGSRDWKRAPVYAPARPPTPRAIPVGQSGATGPCWWMDKMVNVITPATEVTKVEARAAEATSAGCGPTRSGWGPGSIRRLSRRSRPRSPRRRPAAPAREPGSAVPGSPARRHGCPGERQPDSDRDQDGADHQVEHVRPGSSSTRMIDPAMTPGSVPAMSTRARRPPVCPCRQ